jgi:hypothetical protein
MLEMIAGAISEPMAPIAMPTVKSTPKTRPSVRSAQRRWMRVKPLTSKMAFPTPTVSSAPTATPVLGVTGAEDAAYAHGCGEPTDAAAAGVDQVERDRHDENNEHASDKDLRDEAPDQDRQVAVGAQFEHAAQQRTARLVRDAPSRDLIGNEFEAPKSNESTQRDGGGERYHDLRVSMEKHQGGSQRAHEERQALERPRGHIHGDELF